MLTEQNYIGAAVKLNCEVAAIKAVDYVESRGSGFNKNGTPKILFEGHVFWRELEKRSISAEKFERGNETLLYKRWTRVHYGKGENNEIRQQREWARLERAISIGKGLPEAAIFKECALMACSWGRYQIMGNNYKLCGFKDVFDMYFAAGMSEAAHLDMFVSYVIKRRLDDELRDRRWTDFARSYNGPMYYKNKYDIKMAQAFLKFNK